MNTKQELQQLNNRLDKSKHKLAAAQAREDEQVIAQISKDVERITKKIARLKNVSARQTSQQGKDIKSLPFSRTITKKEQADMGKLKKSTRGLVVVHPMTALGREMGLEVVTGFAPKAF